MTIVLLDAHVLESIKHMFRATKTTGDEALAQCTVEELLRLPGDAETNSIAIIVGHLHGNMRSRWTDFLDSDGEKPWRDRDREFDPPSVATKADVLNLWEAGWQVVFAALDGLTPADLLREVLIRGQPHTVVQAAHRQLQHYAYHVGQIVLLARLFKGATWHTLSIARGHSQTYTPSGKGGEPPPTPPDQAH